MVNPIASGMSYLPQTYSAETIQRPALQPEAAVVVTPANETHGSGSPTTGAKAQTSDTPTDPQDSLSKALENINNSMQAWATGMRFELDPEAQRVVVSIIDSASGDVIRTVPSDAVIRVAKMIVKLQGSTIDTKA